MNLRRTRRLFPNEIITLISDSKQRVPKGVKIEVFEKNDSWHEVEYRLKHPKNFRHNFWMTSLGRFIALSEYQKKINDSILHIESDVIVSKDFPLRIFKTSVSQICFPVLSNERGIASILFLPDENSTNQLLSELYQDSIRNPYTSDMLILGNLFKRSSTVSPLPIGPKNKESYRSFTPKSLLNQWESGINKFGGVFDGWDIGGYFFGTDPRNARGISYLQREVPSEFAEIRGWKLNYSKDREFIELQSEETIIPIFCVHLTSKQLALFKIRLPDKRIIKMIKIRETEYSKFYIRVFLNQALQSLLRRIRNNS